MNITETEAMRQELLERMVKDFNEIYIAAAIAEDQPPGTPVIVRVILDEIGDPDDDAFGEYYFTPISEDDNVQYFNAIITITEDIPEDRLPSLYEVMSYINFTIPAGCFAIDKDHNFLSYRLTLPMPLSTGREQIYEFMNIAAGNSAAVTDAYMGVFTDIIKGRMSPGEVIYLLGGNEKD